MTMYYLVFSAEDMAEIFTEWNKGELDSYWIEITADILTVKTMKVKHGPIVDYILMLQAQDLVNGLSQSSLDLGVPLSLITESVFAPAKSLLTKNMSTC